MRDMRDPEHLGYRYLIERSRGRSIEEAVRTNAPNYFDGGHISNDPAQHHSKTPQTQGSLDNGGAS